MLGSRLLELPYGNHMEDPAGEAHPQSLLLSLQFLDPQLEPEQLGGERTAVFIEIVSLSGRLHPFGSADKKLGLELPFQHTDDPAHPLGRQEQHLGRLMDAFLFINLLETADGPGIHASSLLGEDCNTGGVGCQRMEDREG